MRKDVRIINEERCKDYKWGKHAISSKSVLLNPFYQAFTILTTFDHVLTKFNNVYTKFWLFFFIQKF